MGRRQNSHKNLQGRYCVLLLGLEESPIETYGYKLVEREKELCRIQDEDFNDGYEDEV